MFWDIIAFVCSVSGGVATVWKGSIFTDCPDTSETEIILSHQRFEYGVTKTLMMEQLLPIAPKSQTIAIALNSIY